jgi:hypothetical protein
MHSSVEGHIHSSAEGHIHSSPRTPTHTSQTCIPRCNTLLVYEALSYECMRYECTRPYTPRRRASLAATRGAPRPATAAHAHLFVADTAQQQAALARLHRSSDTHPHPPVPQAQTPPPAFPAATLHDEASVFVRLYSRTSNARKPSNARKLRAYLQAP